MKQHMTYGTPPNKSGESTEAKMDKSSNSGNSKKRHTKTEVSVTSSKIARPCPPSSVGNLVLKDISEAEQIEMAIALSLQQAEEGENKETTRNPAVKKPPVIFPAKGPNLATSVPHERATSSDRHKKDSFNYYPNIASMKYGRGVDYDEEEANFKPPAGPHAHPEERELKKTKALKSHSKAAAVPDERTTSSGRHKKDSFNYYANIDSAKHGRGIDYDEEDAKFKPPAGPQERELKKTLALKSHGKDEHWSLAMAPGAPAYTVQMANHHSDVEQVGQALQPSTIPWTPLTPGAMRIGGGPQDDEETLRAPEQAPPTEVITEAQLVQEAAPSNANKSLGPVLVAAPMPESGWWSKTRNRFLLLGIIIVLVGILGAVLGILLSSSSDRSTPSDTGLPNAPTEGPTTQEPTTFTPEPTMPTPEPTTKAPSTPEPTTPEPPTPEPTTPEPPTPEPRTPEPRTPEPRPPDPTPEPPINDDCRDALSVSSDVRGSTLYASVDNGTPSCDVTVTAPGVWYKVQGTGRRMTADTCSSSTDFDTKITVFRGSSCSSLSCTGGNDDSDSCDFQSSVSWDSTSGREYKILVHGFDSQEGDFRLKITSETATDPSNACVDQYGGGSAQFCEDTSSSCTFYTSLNGKSCDDFCEDHGGRCLAAYADADDGCRVDTSISRRCSQTANDDICKCTKGDANPLIDCEDQYGGGSARFCSDTSSSCTFYTPLNGKSCDDFCEDHGGRCRAAYADADDDCRVDTSIPRTCSQTAANDDICECTRW